jgi:hypothetical protein
MLTVLTFDTGQNNGALIPQNYGDQVRSQVDADYGYGSGSGATPNVMTTYGDGVRLFKAGFGTLRNAAYLADSSSASELTITLEASVGSTVSLSGLSLAAYQEVERTIAGLRVVDGETGSVLFSSGPLLVRASGSGPGYTRITFDDVVARQLTISVDVSNLGIVSDFVAIDDIEFAQAPQGGAPMPDLLPDRVVDFYDSGAGPIAGPYARDDNEAGFKYLGDARFLTGAKSGAVGVPFVSLPTNSHVTVEFIDESITDGPGDDFFIAEEDAAGDYAQVEVSADNVRFATVGQALPGVETGFDLTGVDVAGAIRYVRVRGLDNNGSSPGFDLRYVRVSPTSVEPGVNRYAPIETLNRPILIVPGILGSMPTASTWANFIIERGHSPNELVPDPWTRAYDPLINSLQQLGYVRGRDMFVATYDWRLPIAPPDPTDDGQTTLSSLNLSDDNFDFGVEYLHYWIERARASWRASHEESDVGFDVDIVAHSMGGLLTRALVQSDLYAPGQANHNVVRNVYTAGTPHGGAVDAFLQYVPNVDVDQLSQSVTDGVLRGRVSQSWGGLALNLMWSAAKAWGVPSAILREWSPSVRDLLPTFAFGGNGVTPTGTLDITNHLLTDLNAAPSLFRQRLSGRYDLAYGTNLMTASGVEYVFGNALVVKHDPSGDGTVLESSATLGGALNADLHPFDSIEHVSLLAAPDVQMSVLNALGVARPVEFAPAKPSGLVKRWLDRLQTAGEYANHSPLGWMGRTILGFLDPADFLFTAHDGRRLGSTPDLGFVNEFADAYYSGEGPIEFFVVPMDDADDMDDGRIDLYGTSVPGYASRIYSVNGASITSVSARGTLGPGDVRELAVEMPAALPDIRAVGSIEEGDDGSREMVVTVSLSAVTTRDVQANYSTVDGTALAGQDYSTMTGGLTIPAGETTTTVTIPILGDAAAEPNETFGFIISSAIGATAPLTPDVLTILNDDPGPDLAGIVEGNLPALAIGGRKGAMKVRVTNYGQSASAGPSTVSVYTSSDDTVDGDDVRLGFTTLRNLTVKPGKNKLLPMKFVVPEVETSNYFLLVKVEAPNTVGNGLAEGRGGDPPTLHIERPTVDLTGAFTALPTAMVRGRTARTTLALRNDGNVTAAGLVTVTYYLSTDAAFDATDIEVGSAAKKQNLRASSTKALKVPLVLPDEVGAGNYHLIALITIAGQAIETPLDNNVVFGETLVAVA